MKIYFSASRFYRQEKSELYNLIHKTIGELGYVVLDNTQMSTNDGEEVVADDKEKMYSEMVKKMDKAGICVFEASHPSTLHIGHEITVALEKGKVVVVLYTEGHEPVLFRGLKNVRIFWVKYDEKNLSQVLAQAIEEAKAESDVRFNFFVSPKILTYLDWVVQKRMVPRSVFLRDLIEKEMKKDKEFKEG